MIEASFPVSSFSESAANTKTLLSRKQPSFTGTVSVFERMKILLENTERWKLLVTQQIEDIKTQKEIVEGLKPDNQTLTQAEH